MKLLIATGIYAPDIGGPATYTKALATELAREGDRVVVVTYGEGREDKPFRVVGVSRGVPKGLRHLLYFLKIFWNTRGIPIIFAQDTVSAGLPAWFAAFLLRKKFILKVGGDYAWEQTVQRFGVEDLLDDFIKKKYGFRVELLRRVQSFVARRAGLVIVPSEYLKSVALSWKVELARIKVIPNAIVLPPLASRDEARRKLGLDGLILLSIGRLIPWKGFPMLFSVISKMPDVPKLWLVIVGGGPQKGILESLQKALNLEDRVVLVGAVGTEVVAEYLAAADIFLLNTAYEGFSHQILEAFVAGLPVVTTLAGGNQEIIKDGENALVASYDKPEEWVAAIEKILRNKELRSRIIDEAKKSAERYLLTDMIKETRTVLENL